VESLGNKLKEAREAKGLTFDYISRDTNITTKYLEALEKEDYSPFPGEPYVLGFIRNYGEYLGLNPDELMSLYRSIKLREQPVPVEQLLRNSSSLPKILKGFGICIAALALVCGAGYYFVYRLPKKPIVPQQVVRTAAEYVLNNDSFERRMYPGDSILVVEGSNSYKLVFSSVSDAITITTPRGPVMLDLGQEVTVDLNTDGFGELRILAADFVKNDNLAGALLRFEQEVPPQLAASPEFPMETLSSGSEAPLVLLNTTSAFPFTLQAVFQGYCLFRHEILFERDKPGRNEQFYQRSDEINITAMNGIRLGISNAQAVKLQVIGAGRTVPFEAGGAGEVVAADLRWVRDDENRYRLVLLRLE
jgi:transcriptional regulator with XRE-family HTH domain